MSEEVTEITTETVKKTSDGMVKITVEKYNELVETIANQKGSIGDLREQIFKLRSEPPIVNRTVIQKTAKMIAHEHRAWGITLMGVGAGFFAVGAIRYKLGQNEPNV